MSYRLESQGPQSYSLGIISLMGLRKCHIVLHLLGIVTLTAHAELLLFHQRWAKAMSVPVPLGSILRKKLPFRLLLSVVSYVLFWTSLLFCLNLAGILSERDMMLLEVDRRSDLNSSSSG